MKEAMERMPPSDAGFLLCQCGRVATAILAGLGHFPGFEKCRYMVRGGMPNFIGIFTGCIAVGLFTFLWGPFTAHTWFQVPWSAIKGDLIDAIAAWGLCGLWLAWWLRR